MMAQNEGKYKMGGLGGKNEVVEPHLLWAAKATFEGPHKNKMKAHPVQKMFPYFSLQGAGQQTKKAN